MDRQEMNMHLTIGRAYGIEATCGNKVDYKKESSAARAATAMMDKGAKELEPYPCAFCFGWHIGRALTTEEKLAWSDDS